MRILDRYVLQKFMMPFIYCFLGFIAIWFIFDLSDNLQDFLQGKVQFRVLIDYYASQIPQIVVMSLPIGALLALLYALTAMSRSNEIISMLGAGISVIRVLMPFYFVGIILVIISCWFNFEQAPHAAAIKKQMLSDIKRGEKREPGLQGHMFRNSEDLRTWFMRRIYAGQNSLVDLEILQQNKANDIVAVWYAQDAKYYPESKSWVLYKARHVEMDSEGNITKQEIPTSEIVISGWSETPWRIASSVMNPDYLSVSELDDYLSHNADYPQRRLAAYRTHWHYRWALPMFCILVVFLAAPMGIVYSRRGILGGVAVAIGLFFSLVFLSSLAIALGKGDRIPPMLAAWGPLVLYFIIGSWLLWYRSTNRDLPKIKLPGF